MLKCSFDLDFKKETKFYYKLLKEEDFDFKTKDIKVDMKLLKSKINLDIICKNIIDLKIATNSIINSLNIIDKTKKI